MEPKVQHGVNSQITDAVTQTNTKVVGETPAMALSNLLIATSQALSVAAHASTAQLTQTWITAQAATTQSVAALFTMDPHGGCRGPSGRSSH